MFVVVKSSIESHLGRQIIPSDGAGDSKSLSPSLTAMKELKICRPGELAYDDHWHTYCS